MAITGSGSLAISLCVFVISAAFLPKGKFGFLFFFFLSLFSRRCVLRDADIYPRMKPEECVRVCVSECVCVCVCVIEPGGWRSCAVRCARWMRTQAGCLGKSQHHFFYRSRYIRDGFVSFQTVCRLVWGCFFFFFSLAR